MKGVSGGAAALGDYIYFKSIVPLRKISVSSLSDGEIYTAHGGVNPCDLVVWREDRELRMRWLC
jgi:hypothetical protein